MSWPDFVTDSILQDDSSERSRSSNSIEFLVKYSIQSLDQGQVGDV